MASGVVRRIRRYGPSIKYKITPWGSISSSQPDAPPCWTILQTFGIIGNHRGDKGRGEKGGFFLPSQVESIPQLVSWWLHWVYHLLLCPSYIFRHWNKNTLSLVMVIGPTYKIVYPKIYAYSFSPWSFCETWITNRERNPDRELCNANDLFIPAHNNATLKRTPFFYLPWFVMLSELKKIILCKIFLSNIKEMRSSWICSEKSFLSATKVHIFRGFCVCWGGGGGAEPWSLSYQNPF